MYDAREQLVGPDGVTTVRLYCLMAQGRINELPLNTHQEILSPDLPPTYKKGSGDIEHIWVSLSILPPHQNLTYLHFGITLSNHCFLLLDISVNACTHSPPPKFSSPPPNQHQPPHYGPLPEIHQTIMDRIQYPQLGLLPPKVTIIKKYTNRHR